jgi:large subunit ribosomal protein L10
MRKEKKSLVNEVGGHLAKSNYCYVAKFDRLTVGNVAALRKLLREWRAEYHVVKNSVLDHALKEGGFPEFAGDVLRGATAIIVGGQEPTTVAKILNDFAAEKENEGKLALKGGILDRKVLMADEVVILSKLPPLAGLHAQFLSVLQTPARNLLFVFQAAVQSFMRILVAKSKQ